MERIPSSDIKSRLQIRLMTDADYENMSAFSCGVKELDDFFHFEVKECVIRHYLSAYVVYIEEGKIVATFTLMNDALMIRSHSEKEDFISDLRLDEDEDIVEFLNRQTSYPAINIGHLGISEPYQRLGIGTTIIDLVADTFLRQTQTGCQFITVDSLNNSQATRFYTRNSFCFQTNRDANSATRRMYKFL